MSYIPLLYLIVTLIGGAMALANLAPVPVQPRPIPLRFDAGPRRPFGCYKPITTPPGPQLYRTMPSAYTPPPTPRLGARLFPTVRFAPPPPPRGVNAA